MTDQEDGPALTVSALARRLGVAPATLRTWDRRYGLGPTGHSAGAHRRYTPSDVSRLEQMRRLTLDGVSPAEAAKAVRASSIAPPAAALPSASDPPGTALAGGPVIPQATHNGTRKASTDATVRGLVRAALALDAKAIDRTVIEAFDRHGVLWTWDSLLVPLLTTIGERWEASRVGVDVEHLVSEAVLGALRSVAFAGPTPRNSRPVLLASAPEELHTLPLQAISAALAERAVEARVLGARVPTDALAAAVRRGGACAVFVWAHRGTMADQDQIAAIPSMRPPVAVVVGGQGWEQGCPERATRVTSLSEAVTTLQRAAGC